MKIERKILEALALVHPWLLPEQTLLSDANLLSHEPVTLTELKRSLADLEAARCVLSVCHPDRGVQWKITDNGIARIAE